MESAETTFSGLKFVTIGISHQTTNLNTLEACAFKEEQKTLALRELKKRPGIEDGFILSTCNRVEVYVIGREDSVLTSAQAFCDHWFGSKNVDITSALYVKVGANALEHLFSVASSLDAMIPGEAQILGQVKEAFALSRATGKTHPLLDRIVRKAISAAKRVRTETGIAEQTLSLARIAVDLSEKIFGELNERRVLLLGAGEMGDLAARHLLKRGIAELIICNRSYERAANLALELGANVVQWSNLEHYLDLVDIVLVSTGADKYVISVSDVEALMVRRKNRPVFFVDIAMPRNVDPDVNEVANAYLYNIEDLKKVSSENLKQRKQAMEKATQLVAGEVKACITNVQARRYDSTIGELRLNLQDLVQAELERSFNKLPKTETQDLQRLLEQSVNSLVQKLMYHPSQFLKKGDRKGESDLRSIFGLSNQNESADESSADRHKK